MPIADAGGPGDLVQGGVEAALGEHLGRGGEDALPVPLGVAAQRALARPVVRRFLRAEPSYVVEYPERRRFLRFVLCSARKRNHTLQIGDRNVRGKRPRDSGGERRDAARLGAAAPSRTRGAG